MTIIKKKSKRSKRISNLKNKGRSKRRSNRRSYKKRSAKVPRRGKHSSKKQYGCVNLSHLTKYKSSKRKSPPYPANECGGLVKVGKDGSRYKSKKNSRGIYQWRKI